MFDLIIMNPPFTLGYDTRYWRKFLLKATAMLVEGGCLLSVIPDNEDNHARKWVAVIASKVPFENAPRVTGMVVATDKRVGIPVAPVKRMPYVDYAAAGYTLTNFSPNGSKHDDDRLAIRFDPASINAARLDTTPIKHSTGGLRLEGPNLELVLELAKEMDGFHKNGTRCVTDLLRAILNLKL